MIGPVSCVKNSGEAWGVCVGGERGDGGTGVEGGVVRYEFRN